MNRDFTYWTIYLVTLATILLSAYFSTTTTYDACLNPDSLELGLQNSSSILGYSRNNSFGTNEPNIFQKAGCGAKSLVSLWWLLIVGPIWFFIMKRLRRWRDYGI